MQAGRLGDFARMSKMWGGSDQREAEGIFSNDAPTRQLTFCYGPAIAQYKGLTATRRQDDGFVEVGERAAGS